MVFIAILEYFVLLAFNKFGPLLVKDPKKYTKVKKLLDKTDSIFLRLSPLYFISYCAIYTIAIIYF